MSPTARVRGLSVPRLPGGVATVLSVAITLVVFLRGSSAVPLDLHEVRARQESDIMTESATMNGLAADVWWWVFLIVLVVVASAIALTCLLACCFLRRSRRHMGHLEATHLNYQMCSDTHLMSHSESPQKFSTSGNSSSTCMLGPLGAGDHSTQVSSSSLLLFEKSKRRHPSPSHSSGSEEAFKPRGSRSSLASSLSSVPGARLAGADSQNSGDRIGSGRSGRRRSGAIVHVTKLYDGSNLSLASAPSTASMHSAYSASHNSDSSQPTVVEVNVTVGAGSNEQDAQITTAAALAESARQLAQSAAAFGEESDDMWEMYQKRSGAWQMRFHAISNGGHSPASMHRLLSQYPEGAPPAAEGDLEEYNDLDTPETRPVQYTSDPKYQSRLLAHRYSTNGIIPHLVPRPSESVPRCFPRGTEECGSSPGLPRLGRRFSYQCHPYDEGWQRKRTCGHYGSYSPPRRRCGRSESHLRQMHQQSGGQPGGRELKPMRRAWQDVEVPLNTSTSVTVDSSTESAPSPTQSHGESTTNHSTSSEEEVSVQVRQPNSSRPKSAPTGGKTSSVKQGMNRFPQDTPTSPPADKNRQSRGPSVHSLVIARTGAHAKDDVSPSRSASSDNLQSQATSHLSEKGIEEPEKNTLPHLKRQASVPNFKYSSHHPTPSAATPADGAVKLSSRSLARTSSAVSVGGVESAQSGYLASDGSSLTLDGTEQDSASSQVTLGSDEWNDHANSLVVPTSPPIENGFLDSVFERHIQQYSNASSASSVNQLTHPHPLSPPIHTRESGRNYSNHQYYAFKRQPSAPKQLVASSFNYPPHLSPATSNEGVDV